MLRRTLIPLLVIGLLLSSCQAQTPAGSASKAQASQRKILTVFAAASLTQAMADIKKAYQADNPGVEITFNFAGSQQLVQQLAQGAQADVFASANQAQMQAAVTAGRVEAGAAKVFARNRLVVIYPKDNPANLARLQDLARPGLKLILAAKEVPVGGYSLQFLEKASQYPDFGSDFMQKVLANVVSYEENVRAVYSKVSLGEADAGIVYTTDIPKESSDVGSLVIPDGLNVVAVYPIALIQDSPDPELAGSFVEFVLSPSGQGILAGYGFSPPQ